ncbi:uncharacterized protein LOC124937058 [Impatiens glandulifera]|uniref:uncharacterized protein LOC124937058 n=1 Tax=Impatiens glandulifera TaxID=253017 RepID=UPI001FB0C309|nr:uncharacterized protein LOC124937058 [Impatiens glandulifera]
MVREWRDESGNWVAGAVAGGGFEGYAMLWVAIVAFCVISAVIFSCTGGLTRDKTSAESGAYGGGCAAGCGGVCGGGCGA